MPHFTIRRPLAASRQIPVDRDVLVLDADVTAGHKVFEYPADHFTRGADALGDVLLSEFPRHDQAAFVLGRKLEE